MCILFNQDATWTPQIQALAEQLEVATQAMETELGNCLIKYESSFPFFEI